MLKAFKITESTGCDNISAKFLKDSADIITSPLCHIFNLSMEKGIAPDDCKIAQVVSLY